MPVTKGKKSLRHGKRSILIKVRSDIKFSTDKGRATLILGSPSFTNYANNGVESRSILCHSSIAGWFKIGMEDPSLCVI